MPVKRLTGWTLMPGRTWPLTRAPIACQSPKVSAVVATGGCEVQEISRQSYTSSNCRTHRSTVLRKMQR